MNTSAPLHVICDRDVGLFNMVLTAVAHVEWAKREGRIPVVYYTDRNCYWNPGGYEGRNTVWEYYFEPVVPEYPASSIPPDVRALADSRPLGLPGPGRPKEPGFFAPDGTFISNHPNGGIFPGGQSIKGHLPPGHALRHATGPVIRKHIRARPYIVEKARRFYEAHMAGAPCIGVQIRGTDALVDRNRLIDIGKVKFQSYVTAIRRILKAHPDARIFVASDAEESIDKIRAAFGSRVIAYDSVRHTQGEAAGRGPEGGLMPAFLAADRARAARNGEDAVVEYLLLSRCVHLIHNGSALPRMVLLTVLEMPATCTLSRAAYRRQETREWLRRQSAPIRRVADRWHYRFGVARRTVAGQPIARWIPLLRKAWSRRQSLGRQGAAMDDLVRR